jgi:C-terminal processing protease CtpA/Prc
VNHRPRTTRWYALLLGFALAAPPAGPLLAAPEPARLEVAALQADVDVLERAFRELHPGLERYLSPAGVDASFAALRRAYARPRTLADAYLALARFAATLRCGHTYPNFFNQSRTVQARLFEATPRLPFHFRWIDRRMVVTRDFTPDAALPRGTIVTRVDGVPAATILARLLPLARADGANDAKRIDQLNVTGDSRYEAFDVYFPLVHPLRGDAVTLIVQRPGAGGASRVAVRMLSYAERAASMVAGADSDPDAPRFEWRELDGGAAYLRMPSWAMYSGKWAWRPWLAAHLDALVARGAPALIVDLRGNEGGEDVGDELLRRLVATDLPVAAMKRLVRYRAVPDALRPVLDTWDPSFRDWGNDATELDRPWPTAPSAHYFALAGDDPAVDARTVIRPLPPRFAGQVYVLVDAANSSATFQFAALVQREHLGILVGEPTGGNRRGLNGGAFFFLRLPHSGLEIDLPLIGTFPREPEPDAGLVPDLYVPITAADVSAGRDPVMEAVVRKLAATP